MLNTESLMFDWPDLEADFRKRAEIAGYTGYKLYSYSETYILSPNSYTDKAPAEEISKRAVE